MDPRLHEAALSGDIVALQQLLKEDPLLLDKIMAGAIAETPLHIASLLGHISLTAEILKHRPELARIRNEGGAYPLHLASARGHAEIAKELLWVDLSLNHLLDRDGRTPLHLAAANGQVNMLKELLLIDATCARAVSNRGETVLHVCVKHNQVEAAKLFIERYKDLVNAKDNSGNTALHLATTKKQIQMLDLLLTHTNIDVNARNSYELTAFDVLLLTQRETGDMDIVEMLLKAGYKRGKEPRANQDSKNQQTWKNKFLNAFRLWPKKDKVQLKDMENTLMIVATIIATITFQAGLNPPGDLWKKSALGNKLSEPPNSMPSRNSFESFKSFLELFRRTYFELFMFFNMIGLGSSLTVIITLISHFPVRSRILTWILVIAMWVAVSSVALAFTYGTMIIIDPESEIQLGYPYILIGWLGLMFILILCRGTMLIVWLGRQIIKCFKWIVGSETVPGVVVRCGAAMFSLPDLLCILLLAFF
ncbi:uncharacterized protein LOC143851941 [Tasmannia lanceolata]|uniref:uncharacterized protein LOC143851941 n=1 Tax=Tasmannia lanceolata TaxID=3420 RepID=UPI004064B373